MQNMVHRVSQKRGSTCKRATLQQFAHGSVLKILNLEPAYFYVVYDGAEFYFSSDNAIEQIRLNTGMEKLQIQIFDEKKVRVDTVGLDIAKQLVNLSDKKPKV